MGALSKYLQDCLEIPALIIATTMLFVAIAIPARSETVPSTTPAPTVPSTPGWYLNPNNPSYPGYSTGQAACDDIALKDSEYFKTNLTYYFQSPSGSAYGGVCVRNNCCGTVDYMAQPYYAQRCPPGYSSPNSGYTVTPETCVNVSASNQCPSVAAGEVPYILDLPGRLTCSRPDQCLLPNTINPDTGKCEPPRTYIITLDGGTTTEPSTLLPFNAVVKDQNGAAQASKQVIITVNVQNGSGGHIHTENRPKGTFTCSSLLGSTPATCTLTTDNSGQAPFVFVATPVSGSHIITTTCDGCSNAVTKSVDVKVDDLIPIPAAPILYALEDSAGVVIGAVAYKHTANHYLTSTAIGRLNKFAAIYQETNPGAKLYLNDASLVWGGLFDVGSSTPWSSPHSLHDKGRSLDIRAANSGPNSEGAVPAILFPEFIKNAKKKSFNIGLHCKNSSDTNYCLGQPNNRHFHVDF